MAKTARVLWTKGNWYIESRYDGEEDACVCVVNAKTGHVEIPLLHTDYSVAYDWPERLPQYVKNAVHKILVT